VKENKLGWEALALPMCEDFSFVPQDGIYVVEQVISPNIEKQGDIEKAPMDEV
jgi:hypothetical protein